MKKLMKLLLALGLTVALVGCGASSNDEKKEPDTVGTKLVAAFEEVASKDSTTDIAEALLANEVCDFAGLTMDIEPGLLNGFDNYEVTGFKAGTMFAPMIGAVPFIGYVFELEEATNGDEFVKGLKDNANPRWNVCTTADETVCKQVGNKVVFIMCPSSFEEE